MFEETEGKRDDGERPRAWYKSRAEGLETPEEQARPPDDDDAPRGARKPDPGSGAPLAGAKADLGTPASEAAKADLGTPAPAASDACANVESRAASRGPARLPGVSAVGAEKESGMVPSWDEPATMIEQVPIMPPAERAGP